VILGAMMLLTWAAGQQSGLCLLGRLARQPDLRADGGGDGRRDDAASGLAVAAWLFKNRFTAEEQEAAAQRPSWAFRSSRRAIPLPRVIRCAPFRV